MLEKQAVNDIVDAVAERLSGQLKLEHGNRKSITVGSLRDYCLASKEDNRTVYDDGIRWKHVIAHFGHEKLLSEITPEDLIAFRRILKVGRMPATVNKVMTVFKAGFNIGSKLGYYHQNPFATVTKLRENNERDRVCSAEEYKVLYDGCSGEMRLLIVIGYYTGMRLGEIVELTWGKVDLEEKLIRLRAEDTKTDTKRVIPLAKQVLAELNTLRKGSRNERLFLYQVGNYCGKFRKLVAHLAASNPGMLEDLRFHDLRHTALTNFRRAGVDLTTLKRISGHKTMEMLARYNHVDHRDLRDAVQKLDDHVLR